MKKCKLLAFLICDRAVRVSDNKVTLHGLFDRIIIPPAHRPQLVFSVYYKVVVEEPCAVSLRLHDPEGHQIPGNWRDTVTEIGPMQSRWALSSSLFKKSGPYVLELRQECNGFKPVRLATTLLKVDQVGE